PGWGYQLTPKRVLAEMREVGLSATEFGPDGFLPADPQEMAAVLSAHHLTAVGGFGARRLRQPAGAGRAGLAHVAGQHGPDHRAGRRARHPGGAAPTRRH